MPGFITDERIFFGGEGGPWYEGTLGGSIVLGRSTWRETGWYGCTRVVYYVMEGGQAPVFFIIGSDLASGEWWWGSKFSGEGDSPIILTTGEPYFFLEGRMKAH